MLTRFLHNWAIRNGYVEQDFYQVMKSRATVASNDLAKLQDELIENEAVLELRCEELALCQKECEAFKMDAHEAETKLAKAMGRLSRLNRLESSLKHLKGELRQWKGASKAWRKHEDRMQGCKK